MILIVKYLKAFSLLKKIIEALKILNTKKHLIKNILKMFYNPISPWFSYRDEECLNAKLKAKTNYQSKRMGIAIATTGR